MTDAGIELVLDCGRRFRSGRNVQSLLAAG
jgi:hypothetical protein